MADFDEFDEGGRGGVKEVISRAFLRISEEKEIMEEQIKEEEIPKLTPQVEEEVELTPEVERRQIFRAEHLIKIFENFIISAALVFLIGYLNFLLIRYWFIGDFNQNMWSIEISYIQMAKFWVSSGTAWQPWWYLGHPWHVFYTPLLPALEVLAHRVLGFNFGHAYRVITGVGYVLAPVSVFFFVWQISKSKTGAFVSALFYSFVPSIMAYFNSSVARDVLSGHFEPRRFAIMVRWGEGPHTLALVFLAIFGLFISRYFERGQFRDLFLASLFFTLVALTNAIAVWAAILLLFSMILSEITRGVEIVKIITASFSSLILSFGLLAFWYNLPFLSTFFKEGGSAISNWEVLFPWGLSLVLLGAFGIFWVVKKLTRNIPGAPFSIFWFLMFFGIVYVYYASGERRLEYAPQALRFNTEVDLGLSVLVGVFVSFVFLRLSSIGKGALAYLLRIFALFIFALPTILLLALGFRLISALPVYTKSISETKLGSVENTAEFRVSQNLTHLSAGSQARVLVPGNYSFWLNYFVDVPQLRGALFQSSTHFWPEHIYYQLTNGTDAEISLAWLKIANVGKLVYTTGASAETFKDYKAPQTKFEGILTQKLADFGDIYYDVPLKGDRMAKLVDYKKILGIKKPFNAIDSKPIFAYVAALEEKANQKVDVSKISDSRMRLSGEVKEGEGVLVQQTYDSGWRVKSLSGVSFNKKRDNFDFMILVPRGTVPPNGKASKFELELVYTKPITVYIGYLITLLTFVFIIRRIFNIPIIFKKSSV